MQGTQKTFYAEKTSVSKAIKFALAFLVRKILNDFILSLKSNRRYHFDLKHFKGLNLGCSVNCPKNWLGISAGINIYFLKFPKIFYRFAYSFSNRAKKEKFNIFFQKKMAHSILHHDLKYGIPFPINSIPHIFSSHLFEHLSYEYGNYLANECFRVLKPGGSIRIIVPSLDEAVLDIECALQKYKKGDLTSMQKYLTSSETNYFDSFSTHKYMYNFETLKKLLENAGFINVTKYGQGKGKFPDILILETQGGLVVEAIKPLIQSEQ